MSLAKPKAAWIITFVWTQLEGPRMCGGLILWAWAILKLYSLSKPKVLILGKALSIDFALRRKAFIFFRRSKNRWEVVCLG